MPLIVWSDRVFLLHFLEFGNPKWLSQAPGLTGFYFNILCDKILFITIDEHPGISYSMRKRDWHDAFMSFPNLTTTLFTTGFIVVTAGRFLRILLMSRSEFFLLTLKFIFMLLSSADNFFHNKSLGGNGSSDTL